MLALVACGGGGGGYYGDENSSSANTGNSGNTGNGSGNNSTDNSTQIAETINFVDLKDISGGIYFVKVFDSDKSYCKKLIVEHNWYDTISNEQ